MKVPIEQIKPNPQNPRLIKDENYQRLLQSIKDFPEMAEIREVIVNKDMVILGGNMRFRAMKEAGWTEIPVKIVDLPEDKQREFIIKDNVSGGDWDWEQLAKEWDATEITDWGLDIPEFGNLDLLDDVNGGDESSEWVGMPEFAAKPESLKIIIHFETEESRQEFMEMYPFPIRKKLKNTYITVHPYKSYDDLSSMKAE